ncbi:MAG TPA: class I SAM-dependent methyltransferase [Thermomicrobiales bacterium]|nr:class I SAM-dependent methyltransferase [Thermomicrobiales bacterium]
MASVETAIRSEPMYAMGYTGEERQRLIAQARLLEDSTRHLMLDAGIAEGMAVLDIGCGVGDVSFLAASLVGDRGKVVGVDRDPRALAVARDRAAGMGLANVEFLQSDLQRFEPDGEFDAFVGRLVLLYLPDPAEVLRNLLRRIRPGGAVAFQDFQFDHAGFSYPPVAQMELFWEWFVTTLRRAGGSTSMGLELYQTFIEAGLPAPHLRAEHPMISAVDSQWLSMPEMVLRSILPLLEQFGIATAAEVDVDTWTDRLAKEVIGRNAVCSAPMIFSAWTTVAES